jgi:hypothetical protein
VPLWFTLRVKIDVPANALRTGALLEIGRCARHDAPATRARTRRFTTEPPGIIVVLALFSFFVVFLLAAAFRKDVHGPIPECDRCRASYRKRITAGWISVVACIGVIVLSAVASSGPALLVGIALLVLAISSFVTADLGRVRGTLDDDLVWVELRGIDPAFGTAVQDRVQSAPQLDPWATPLG